VFPLGADLPNLVRKSFWENGLFPVSAQQMTPLKKVILSPTAASQQEDCAIEQWELDVLTPPEFVEVEVARILTRYDHIVTPQYRVFDFFYPSVIFNFNVDNLAYCIDSKHEILYPHGKVNPYVAHSLAMQNAIKWLTIPQSINKSFRYWRPIPEDSSVTSRIPYHRLKDIFATIKCLCIIGYSFGSKQERIDDGESFEMLVDLLRWKPKPVLIINPNPLHLVELFQSTLKQTTVFGLCCKWNILAKFIISHSFRRAYQVSQGSAKALTSAYLFYEELCSTP